MLIALPTKKGDLIIYLAKYNIDVVVVCETFLQPGQTFKVANYKSYRLDRSWWSVFDE